LHAARDSRVREIVLLHGRRSSIILATVLHCRSNPAANFFPSLPVLLMNPTITFDLAY